MKLLKKYLKNKLLTTFFIRTAFFLGVFLFVKFFIFFFFRHTNFFITYLRVPEAFKVSIFYGLAGARLFNALIFTAIIFLIFIRNRLKELKPPVFDKKQIILFGSLSALFLFLQYAVQFFIRSNLSFTLKYAFLFGTMKYLATLSFIVFLALACYSFTFIKDFIKLFYKQILSFSLILIIYYNLIGLFQHIWFPLSKFVATTLYFIFSLTFANVHLSFVSDAGPRLGVDNFIVGISKDCSGIDSLLLFISLFAFLVVLNWKEIDKKRMAIIFIPGILGTVAYNILRVYLLMLVGIFISPEFAIDAFHSNVGWILFLLFFWLYWHFGSEYVYKK